MIHRAQANEARREASDAENGRRKEQCRRATVLVQPLITSNAMNAPLIWIRTDAQMRTHDHTRAHPKVPSAVQPLLYTLTAVCCGESTRHSF